MDAETRLDTESRIKDRGQLLTSMAHLGLLCVVSVGVVLLAGPYVPGGLPAWLVWIRDPAAHTATSLAGKLVFSSSTVLLIISWLAPLLALRRLGKTLGLGEALSLPVADAFRRLAHSVAIVYTLLQIAAGFIEGVAAGVVGTGPHHSFPPMGDMAASLYLWIVTCVCLYSVAHLMKLAAEAAEDSRSIV